MKDLKQLKRDYELAVISNNLEEKYGAQFFARDYRDKIRFNCICTKEQAGSILREIKPIQKIGLNETACNKATEFGDYKIQCHKYYNSNELQFSVEFVGEDGSLYDLSIKNSGDLFDEFVTRYRRELSSSEIETWRPANGDGKLLMRGEAFDYSVKWNSRQIIYSGGWATLLDSDKITQVINKIKAC